MYGLFKSAAFLLSAESSHELTIDALAAVGRLKISQLIPPVHPQKPVEAFGMTFPNGVGLAAGLDKNGDAIDALGALGFGFVEVGTVTPKPQPGNPQPRLFRIPEREAIINRMGFNNKGVDYLVERVKKANFSGVIGINIGKNKDTPEDEAVNDYLYCLNKVYPHAGYIVVNLSSPNTPGLRALQFGEKLESLIEALKARQSVLSAEYGHKPILIKIAPDLSDEEVSSLAEVFNRLKVDGVVATNTTIDRETVQGCQYAEEVGGLSGAPVRERSNKVLKQLREALDDDIDIIGVGGILSQQDALEKRQHGAALVQVYSGLIYQGPSLVRDCVRALAK